MNLETWEWVLFCWAAPFCIGCSVFALWVWWTSYHPARLDDQKSPSPTNWPRLSVIIPARNEGTTLEAALQTLLAQSYPNLELVLIDDRSTDDTGAIIDRMSKDDPRIKPVHIRELPAGWLGKVHALHHGVQLASGDWFLFTDADVHFGPDALQRAIAHCLDARREFMAIIPTFEAHGLIQDAAMTTFGIALSVWTRLDKLDQEGSDAFMGVGAFNLVERRAYQRSEGFEFLKMEIADDIGLAYVLHRAKARAALLLGGDLVSIDWYPDLRSMIRGMEKNSFSCTAHFSFLRCALLAGFMISVAVAPLVAALQPTMPLLSLAGVVALGAGAFVHLRTGRMLRISAVRAFCAPIGMIVSVYALLRSAAICWREGGIRWRETWYPVEALKAGQRLKL